MSSQSDVCLNKLIVGMPGQIVLIKFDGSSFTVVGRYVQASGIAGWLLFKAPNFLWSLTKLGDGTNLCKLSNGFSGPSTTPDVSSVESDASWTKLFFDKPTFVSGVKTLPGGAHLAFNSDRTRIIEPCPDAGRIDIWDSSAMDGSVKRINYLPIPGTPTRGRTYHRPCKAVLDPTGRFFVVPNKSGASLLIIESRDGRYEITDTITVPDVGPLRVAFIKFEGATYLVLLTADSHELILYSVEYADSGIAFTEMHRRNTYVEGEQIDTCSLVSPLSTDFVVAYDEDADEHNRPDLYVLNRAAEYEEDHHTHYVPGHVAHFVLTRENASGEPRLMLIRGTPYGGHLPRAVCLSMDPDRSHLFVCNAVDESDDEPALIAFARHPITHSLESRTAVMSFSELRIDDSMGDEGNNPIFIRELR
ncbi:hypothetical protein F5Y04DRAFT_178491 [Hypomontagnella monticulosa]|nr:hypothetical protein F5Y04DRAFT_178491 [Hypomontagnella monticulosa]